MWELVVLVGITWAGPGGTYTSMMPTKEDCFQALDSVKISQATGANVSVEKGKSTVAFCRYNAYLNNTEGK